MIEYPLLFLAGLAGSWHCVGMCGGFACVLGSDRTGAVPMLVRQLLYNLGRLTTYAFIGGVVGHLAAGLCVAEPGMPPTAAAQRVLAVASGLLLIVIGLQFLGWIRGSARPLGLTYAAPTLTRALRDILRTPGPAAPLAFGALNGFLPCPLVYAIAAQAMGSGSAVAGMLTMLVFGLGTFPAMLLVGGVGSRLRAAINAGSWGRHSVEAAGALILLLGLITLTRGVVLLDTHRHLL